jgi:serine/threonine-protein kinase PknG
MEVPVVPEEKRFCHGCRAEVGRPRAGRRARATGFCSKCRTPYSFEPALTPGALVAGQYRVLGCLAYGGLGWIYLAQDERVSNRWVVLKGVLNASDPDAVAVALAERQFLARVEHPNVVRIYNVVEHAGAGYIVMEYVGGRTLRAVLRDRRREGLGPLPVELAIAYVLAILPAFAYLHALGLAYNDFKPDNVMLHGDDVKLVDLGAVTRLDDEHPLVYGTDGFEAPEVRSSGPSVPADLYAIARGLATLVLDLPTYHTTHRYRLPTPDEEPLFRRHESLYRFLMKAAAHLPGDRYQTAEEMAAALEAVLRETTAVSPVGARPAPSRLFGADVLALHWAEGAPDPGPDWGSLPLPRIDAADPEAAAVLDALALGPAEQLASLGEALAAGQVADTAEVRIAMARALIELDRHDEAEVELTRAEAMDRREWRGNWYRGLSLLARGRPFDAGLAFDIVYSEIPGELVPQLALGVAAEAEGRLADAARRYEVVSLADASLTTATFGLARARLAMGDVPGAVAAWERVPHTSRLRPRAELALARALVHAVDPFPTIDDLARASAALEGLQLPAEQRAELTCDLLEAALGLLVTGAAAESPGVRLLGVPLQATPVRLALERAYRDLAWVAVGDEKIRLVDCANDVRPVTRV